jgi:Ran GTPase-activating protein (RanGAP) involved in mRNA processing and transport
MRKLDPKLGSDWLEQLHCDFCSSNFLTYHQQPSFILDDFISLANGLQHERCRIKALSINFEHERFQDADNYGLIAVIKALNHTNCTVTDFHLGGYPLNNRTMIELASVLMNQNCKINSLSFVNTHLSDAHMECLAMALAHRNCNVQELYLPYCNIDDRALSSFAQALCGKTQLKELHLNDNSISSAGLAALAKTIGKSLCDLEQLELECNKVSDDGVVVLAELLASTDNKLSHLILAHNDIQCVGAHALAKAMQSSNCMLTTLHLGGNVITESGVVSLAQSLGHAETKLENLYLECGDSTDEQCYLLAQAMVCDESALQSLSMRVGEVSSGQARRLSSALASVKCGVEKFFFDAQRIESMPSSCMLIDSLIGNEEIKEIRILGEALDEKNLDELLVLLSDQYAHLAYLGFESYVITGSMAERIMHVLFSHNTEWFMLFILTNQSNAEALRQAYDNSLIQDGYSIRVNDHAGRYKVMLRRKKLSIA